MTSNSNKDRNPIPSKFRKVVVDYDETLDSSSSRRLQFTPSDSEPFHTHHSDDEATHVEEREDEEVFLPRHSRAYSVEEEEENLPSDERKVIEELQSQR